MNRPNSRDRVSQSSARNISPTGRAERRRRQLRTTPNRQTATQIRPLRSSYRVRAMPPAGWGRKEAMISSPTVSSIRAVGTSSSTWVSPSAWTGWRSLRNSTHSTPREARAPSSTPQKMPGRPSIQKKSKKFISAKPPSSILVVSPTMVAAPWRLEETAMAISTGTGEMDSRRAMARPTGAIISTVATLSTKALMTPAKRASTVTAPRTSGTWRISCSARRRGIRLSMKRETVPMVPAIISSTLKSTAPSAWPRDRG